MKLLKLRNVRLFARRNGSLTLLFRVNFDEDSHFRAIANLSSLVLSGSPRLAFFFYTYLKV